ncbi:hypothetical protein Desdi_1654 [Desulfitobacterium dichloroeliminans LMG P-21439]|uniref:ABC-2 family transporter protein n=1 Tax=Desulfitobacterium dichloroeliminans (strain LMG P-21439 / DCA1) TaxID=871963 RepID=L0F870_DESDL|nr:hypothetical protein [Desulfitobacterium dichloroeliminans]AGA69143.1 hypothetical protein Desdi_1654 [Desulfitobacterium dichloroeliminans LMG P-21439]
MLSKLMKYELKATGRVFLPLFLAALAFALIARFTGAFSAGQQWETPVIISTIMYISVMVGMFVMTLIMTIQRFYKNLLSEEGYLMFTLPVKPWQHIVCKMLVSMFWVVLSFLIALCSILMIAYKAGDWGRFMGEAGPVWQEISDFLGSSLYLYSFEGILGVIFTLASAILILYASIAIGHLFNQYRVLASFAAFIGLNVLTQIITMAITKILGFNLDQHIEINLANFHSMQTELHTIIVLTLMIAALEATAYFFITERILSKRLNLE